MAKKTVTRKRRKSRHPLDPPISGSTIARVDWTPSHVTLVLTSPMPAAKSLHLLSTVVSPTGATILKLMKEK